MKKHLFLKSLLIAFGLLIMSINTAWAGAGFYEAYFTYSYNGTSTSATYTDGTNSTQTIALGTLTADFKITSIYLKNWKNGSGDICGGLVEYYIDSDKEYQPSWGWSDLGWYKDANHPQLGSDAEWTVASYNTGASGSYTFWYRFKTWGGADGGCSTNYYIPTGGVKNKFTYNIAPPAISSFSVAKSGYLSGSGTEGDPYLVAYNGTLTFTVSGSKARTDGNSTIKYWTNSGDKQESNVLTVSGITSTDLTSVVVHAQCINNSSSSLVGTESTETIYYKVASYAITLDDNGDYQRNGSATAMYGRDELTINTLPSRTGYHVDGYYGEGGLTTYISDASGNLQPSKSVSTTPYTNSNSEWIKQSATTLYTKWTANDYTIAFDPNDDNYVGMATGTTASINATYDVNYTLTSNGFERAGYTFAGWTTNADGTGTEYTDGQTGVSNLSSTDGGTATLYAKWTPLTYKVTLDYSTNGGTSGDTPPSPITVTMGATYGSSSDLSSLSGELPTPTKYGYDFVGWYDDPSSGTKVEKTTQVTTAHDHTLWAHFTETSYVYFYNNVGWEHVYVVFNAYWDSDKGTGSGRYRVYAEMEQIDDTKVYKYRVPAYATEQDWQYQIAFNNKEQIGYDFFSWGSAGVEEAIFRADFDSYATMFVPSTNKSDNSFSHYNVLYHNTQQYGNWGTHCHKNGYWRRYNGTDPGYLLKGDWDGWKNDFYFHGLRSYEEDTVYTFTKYLTPGTYNFLLYKHCKTRNTQTSIFTNTSSSAITGTVSDLTFSTANTRPATNSDTRNSRITVSVAGDYKFTLICGKRGDLRMSVTYPGSPVDGDYRVRYSWRDKSNVAHSRTSDTIHFTTTSRAKRISMFVHSDDSVKTGTRLMNIQKWNGSAWVNLQGTDNQDITIDLSEITECGVYDFYIHGKHGDNNWFKSSRYYAPYGGVYYVRSDATGSGWDYYDWPYLYGENRMTYSAYSLEQTLSEPYSHYYCVYVNNTKTSVKFTVATEFSSSICDTLTAVGDATINAGSNTYDTLPAPANVRFEWNNQTNTLHRSYLKSADGAGNERFLVLHGSDNKVRNSSGSTIPAAGSLYANELQFSDSKDWIYEVDLKAYPGAEASLIAAYNGADRYLIGGASSYMSVLGGEGDNPYPIHAIYDFKTNRLMVAWKPDPEVAVSDSLSKVDMLWVRRGQESAQQVTFGGSGKLTKVTAVGAIEFRYSDIIGKVSDWSSGRGWLKYFISFPFDVNVSDLFGLNKCKYGREYIIQKYNGAKRAKNGLYSLDGTFWENLTTDSVMHANEGYCLILDNDYWNFTSGNMWENKTSESSVYLYFPASDTIQAIKNVDGVTTVSPHLSTKDVPFTWKGNEYNHQETDSHWNLIGSPYFHDAYVSSSSGKNGKGEDAILSAYYAWDKNTNEWSAEALDLRGTTQIKAMSCILVQWCGTINWATASTDYNPAAPAPRRNEETKNYIVQLDLLHNGESEDKTFVELRDGADAGFQLCEDLFKMEKTSQANICAYAGTYDVAYSATPMETDTVRVGVTIRQAGSYTFSMPTDFSGTVTLVDSFNGERTNLALDDYEVNLEPGYIRDRFYLEFNIQQTTTSLENTNGHNMLNDGGVHKFIQNDQMYILKNGVIYDARGARVQ